MKFEGKIEVVRQGKRKVVREPRKPVGPRIPRISKLMALAIKMQGMVDRGEVRDYAELARLAHVTRARMTQIMNLNLLAPEIQEALLFLEPTPGRDSVTLKGLQKVCLQSDWSRQMLLPTERGTISRVERRTRRKTSGLGWMSTKGAVGSVSID